MKTKILAVAVSIFALSACDLLEEKPESFISPSNFYKNSADAVAAVNAVYDVVSSIGVYNQCMWWVADMSTDDVTAGVGVNNLSILQIDSYTHSSLNNRLDLLWQTTFDGINRANQVLSHVPDIDMDVALKTRILGEARFLRGLFYFNLVRIFGPVPILTVETGSLTDDLGVSRSPVEDVYALILEDLGVAESGLAVKMTGDDVGRATQGAAKSLLAKVYLTRGEWDKAASKAKEVIDNAATYGYDLWANYAEAFTTANENGKESVFSAQFSSGIQEGSSMMIYCLPRNTIVGQGFSSFVPTTDIYNSYEPNDARKTFTYWTTFTKGTQTITFSPAIYKYNDPAATNTADASTNYPVIRYADVLLMYAEAANELGQTDEALTYINQVRTRAKLTSLSGLSSDGIRDAVLKERRLELAFEGHRWFDLVRTGRLVSTLRAKGNTNIQDYHVLYPVPQRDIDVNSNLKPQNAGY